MSGQHPISYKSQRGQTAVMVMLFMAILIVSAVGLYKAGKLTSNKMMLQNAADSAAFSMSTMEARDMNFASYMNRAIVANEVAIGQMVGLASWAFHFRSFADYLDTYNNLFLAPITLGVSTGIVTPITSVWRGIGTGAVTFMKGLANFGTSVVHIINKVYGIAELVHHSVTIISSVGILDEMMKQNGPEGTKISDFGMVSLIAHILTYGSIPGLPNQFASVNLPTKKIEFDAFGEQDSPYARLSALIRDSRDPFTAYRGVDPITENPDITGWELRPPGFPIDKMKPDSFKFTILDLDIAIASIWVGVEIEFYFDLALKRKGGGELRVLVPATGKFPAGQHANWSSADTTGLFLDIFLGFEVTAEACTVLTGCEDFDLFGGELDFGDSTVSLKGSFLGEEFTIIPEMFFPTSAPFGSGFAEVGKQTKNNLGTTHMNLAATGGVIEIDDYGEAPNNSLAWLSPGPGPIPPIGVAGASQIYETILGSRVNKSYSGLPMYVDTAGPDYEPVLGIGAPYLLIGMVQDEDDFDSNAVASEPSGRFSLNEALADEELAVLSKSELYFSRPTDTLAQHFHRGDGQAEYGSAFNPYWQARLVETNYAERLLALLVQQKEDFINLGQSFNLIFGDLLSYISG